MTDTNETKTTTAKTPSHIAYQVREGKEDGKGFWTRVGAAWPHTDGNGFNVQLDATPVDGRIVIRVASEKKE